MIEIKYSLASTNDFLNIAELDRIGWGNNRQAEFIPDGEHVWRLWVDHAFVIVAKHNRNLIGVILSFPSTKDKIHYLHKILVKEEYRGKGIGNNLMIRICNIFDKNNITALLTTDSNNYSMQKLSEKNGFDEREFVRGFYRANEDRWVYKRTPKTQ